MAARKKADAPAEDVVEEAATEEPQKADAPTEDGPALGSPAERRADYLRALTEEREQLERIGKADRVKEVDAEIKRVKSAPVDRKSEDLDEA